MTRVMIYLRKAEIREKESNFRAFYTRAGKREDRAPQSLLRIPLLRVRDAIAERKEAAGYARAQVMKGVISHSRGVFGAHGTMPAIQTKISGKRAGIKSPIP